MDAGSRPYAFVLVVADLQSQRLPLPQLSQLPRNKAKRAAEAQPRSQR